MKQILLLIMISIVTPHQLLANSDRTVVSVKEVAQLLLSLQGINVELKANLVRIQQEIAADYELLEANEKAEIDISLNILKSLSELDYATPFNRKKPNLTEIQKALTSIVDLITLTPIDFSKRMDEIPQNRIAARTLLTYLTKVILTHLTHLRGAFLAAVPQLNFQGMSIPPSTFFDQSIEESAPGESLQSKRKDEVKTFRGNYLLLMNLLNDPQRAKPFKISLAAAGEGTLFFRDLWGKKTATSAESIEVGFNYFKNEVTGQFGIDPNSLELAFLSSTEHKNKGEVLELAVPETQHHIHVPKFEFFKVGRLSESYEYTSPTYSETCRVCIRVTYLNGKLTLRKISVSPAPISETNFTGEVSLLRVIQTATIEMKPDLSSITTVEYTKTHETMSADAKVLDFKTVSHVRSKSAFTFQMKNKYVGRTWVSPLKEGVDFIPFSELGNFTGKAFQDSSNVDGKHQQKGSQVSILKFPTPSSRRLSCQSLFAN